MGMNFSPQLKGLGSKDRDDWVLRCACVAMAAFVSFLLGRWFLPYDAFPAPSWWFTATVIEVWGRERTVLALVGILFGLLALLAYSPFADWGRRCIAHCHLCPWQRCGFTAFLLTLALVGFFDATIRWFANVGVLLEMPLIGLLAAIIAIIRIQIANPEVPRSPEEAPGDELERSHLADHLAEMLANLPKQGAQVFAVTGQWGSGKTFLLDLAVAELRKKEKLVGSFDAWNFRDSERLPHVLLATIARIVGERVWFPLLRWRVSRLAQAVTPLHWGSLIGLALPDFVDDADHQRSQLQAVLDLLPNKEKPLIVIVDDADRLPKEDLLTLLKMLGLCMKMRGLVFVLTFDEGNMQKLLESAGIPDLGGYLSKVISQRLELKTPPPPVMRKFADKRISEAIKSWPQDEKDFSDAGSLLGRLQTFFKTPRQVLDLARDLGNYAPVVSKTTYWLDFFLLRWIALNRPALFDEIYRMRHYFCQIEWSRELGDVYEHVAHTHLGKENHREDYFKEIRDRLQSEENKIVIHILEVLFPHFKGRQNLDQNEALRKKRVVHPAHFNTYFHFKPISTQVEFDSVDELLNKMMSVSVEQGVEALVRFMKALADGRKDWNDFFDAIRARTPVPRDDNAAAIALGLSAASDLLPPTEDAFENPRRRLGYIVMEHIGRINDPQRRNEVTAQIVDTSPAFELAGIIVFYATATDIHRGDDAFGQGTHPSADIVQAAFNQRMGRDFIAQRKKWPDRQFWNTIGRYTGSDTKAYIRDLCKAHPHFITDLLINFVHGINDEEGLMSCDFEPCLQFVEPKVALSFLSQVGAVVTKRDHIVKEAFERWVTSQNPPENKPTEPRQP